MYFVLFGILGREGGFQAFLSITAFAFIPTVFSQAAGVVRAFAATPIRLEELGSLSLASFLERDTPTPLVFATISSLDFVSIWILILLAIGYGFVARQRVSKGVRMGVVFGVFVVYAVLKVASTVFMTAAAPN
jgi:hypothetical protein